MAKQLNVNLNFKANTAEAKRQIEDLQRALSQVTGDFSKGSSGQGMDEKLHKAAQAAQELQRHIAAAVNQDTGKLNLNKFENSIKKSGASISELSSKLLLAGNSGQAAFVSLASSIAAADRPVITLNKHLSGMLTVIKNTARWQISSSILHGFMGAIQTAYGYAKDLNASLNDIRIVTGYNTDQMAKFALEANKAAKALSTTTTDYTKASLIYYQQGLGDAEVQARTDATVKMANVTGQAAQTVSDQLTAIWNNFAKGSSNLEYFADVITALGASTASSSAEISEGLEKFAAVAETVGLSYEYATAALATVTAETRQSADVVGTAFKTLFARIEGLKLGETLDDGTSLNKYSAALAAVGINIKESNGELKAMDDILDEMGAKWQTLSKDQQVALAQTVAGVRQYNQLIALMENWDIMQKNLETARGSSGALQEQQEIYAQSWEAANKRVRASMEAIYSDLIDDKFFIKITNGWANILHSVDAFIDGIGGMKTILISLASFFTARFAKNIEASINNIKINFQTMFQTPQQQAANHQKMFNDLMANAKGINGADFTDSQKVALQGAQQLATARNKLMLVEGQISKEQKAQLEGQLMINQAVQEQVSELARKVEEEKEALEALRQEYDWNLSIRELEKLRSSELKIYERIERNAKANYLKDPTEENRQKYAQATAELSAYREETEKLKRCMADMEPRVIRFYESFLNGNEQIVKIKDILPSFSNDLSKLTRAYNEFGSIQNRSGKNAEIANEAMIKAKEQISALQTKLQQLGIIGQEDTKILAAFGKVTGANTTNFTRYYKALREALEEFNVTGEKQKQILAAIGQGGYFNKIEQGLNKVNEAEKKLADQQQRLNNLFAQFNPNGTITALGRVITAAAGLGQVAMLINSVKSAIQAWKNEDLSFGEKMVTTFMSLSMIIPSAVTAFQSLSKAFSLFNVVGNMAAAQIETLTAAEMAHAGSITASNQKELIQILIKEELITEEEELTTALLIESMVKKNNGIWNDKIVTDTVKIIAKKKAETQVHNMNTKALIMEQIAAQGLSKTMWGLIAPFLALAAAIAAIIIVIKVLVEAFKEWKANTPEGKLASVKEETEMAGEAAKEAKNKYSELLDTISNYKSARDKISELTKGTEEYTEAVRQANEYAMELINTYGLISGQDYTFSNGIFNIDNEAFSRAQEEYYNKFIQAQSLQNSLLARQKILQDQVDQRAYLKQQTGYNDSSFKFMGTEIYNSETVKQLKNDVNKIISANYKELLTGTKEDVKANLASFLGYDINNLSKTQDKYLEGLVKSRDELFNLAESSQKASTAIQDAGEIIAANVLQGSESFQNASDAEQEALIKILGSQHEQNVKNEIANLQQQGYNTRLGNRREFINDLSPEILESLGIDENTKVRVGLFGRSLKINGKKDRSIEEAWEIIGEVRAVAAETANAESDVSTILAKLSNEDIPYMAELAGAIFDPKNINPSNLTRAELKELTKNPELMKQGVNTLTDLLGITTEEAVRRINQAIAQIEADRASFENKYGEGSYNENLTTEENLLAVGDPEALINLASQYSNTTTEIERYKAALEGLSTITKEQAENELRLAIAAGQVAEAYEDFDITADAIEDVAQQWVELGKQGVEGYEAFAENKELATKAAASYIRLNRTLEELQPNYEKYCDVIDLLTKNEKAQVRADKDMNDSYEKLKKGLAGILDVSDDLIDVFEDDNFIGNNGELIKKAIDGDVEAINKLRIAAAESIEDIIKIPEEYGDLSDKIAEILTLDPGTDLLGDPVRAKWIQDMVWLMQQAGWSATRIEDAFNSMGITLNLAPMGKSLDEAVDMAGKAGAQAADNFAKKSKVTIKRKGRKKKYKDWSTVPTVTVKAQDPVPLTFNIPTFFPSLFGGIKAAPSTNPLQGSVQGFSTTVTTVPYETEKNSTIEALEVQGATVNEKSDVIDDNVGGGSKPGGKTTGSGGGGSSPKAATTSRVGRQASVPRYKEVDDTLEKLTDAISDANTAADKLYGPNRWKQIEKVIALTKEEIKAQKQKAKEAEQYLEIDKKTYADSLQALNNFINDHPEYANIFGDSRFQYNVADDGTILNWTDTRNLGNSMLHALEVYANTGTNFGNGDLQNDFKENIYNVFKEMIDVAYGDQDQIDETRKVQMEQANNIRDLYNTLQEINYNLLTAKFEIKVKLRENELQIIENMIKAIEDNVFKRSEIYGLMSGKYSNNLESLNLTELNNIKEFEKGLNEKYQLYLAGDMENGIDQAKYLEGLQTVFESTQSFFDNFLQWNQEMREYYAETLNTIADELDFFINQMDHLSDKLEHYKNVLTLFGKEKDYKTLDTVLRGQLELAKNQERMATDNYNMFKRQYDEALAYYNSIDESDVEKRKSWFDNVLKPALEKMQEAESAMWEAQEGMAEAAQAVMENLNELAYQVAEQALTAGRSFDALAESMDLASKYQDEYLTKTNQIYETSKLLRDVNRDIDTTNNKNAKTKLKNFADEIEQMREQGQLSQLDLKIAQARYEVLKAQIALEEAQNAKSTVRLQRDSEGNYGYVYTADRGAIDDAEQELANKTNDLYNLVLENTNNYAQAIIDLDRDTLEQLKALDQNAEDYEQRRDDILRRSMALRQSLWEQHNTALFWLGQTAATDTNEAWTEEFFVPNVATMDEWQNTMNNYIDRVTENHQEYMDTVTNDKELIETLDNMEENTRDVVRESDNLTKQSDILRDSLEAEADAVLNATERYYDLFNAIKDVIGATIEYQSVIGNKMAENSEEQRDITQEIVNAIDSGQMGLATSLFYERQQKVAANPNKNYKTGQDWFNNDLRTHVKDVGMLDFWDDWWKTLQYLDGGGYTGEWGNSGKLAVLHQKELVLNESDTSNFLAGIKILRDITNAINLRAAADANVSLASPVFGGSASSFQQTVTIHADFPNAVNHSEIEEAFNNLVNRASQYANRY